MSKPTAWLATGRERLFVAESARPKSTRDACLPVGRVVKNPGIYINVYMKKPNETHFLGNVNQKALIQKDGKILLVQYPEDDAKHPKSVQGKWDMPGGRLNEGENAISGLKREVFEELGIEIVVEKILATGTYTSYGGQPIFFLIYQAFLFDEKKTFQFNDGEVGEARWFDPKDFFALPIIYPEYKEALKYILV